MTEFDKVCEYIGGIPKFAPKTELNNTRMLLASLGNPTERYKNVHIAGTNGKGSVSKMIALMLEKAGFRVGLFTSPHLIKMNERISVNGADIKDEDFVKSYESVMEAVNTLLEGESGFAHPAYFEFLFGMAAKYFEEQKCDYVVWETGLGGRLDATNTTTPVVSIITSIGMDHMQYLGNTIEAIAGEKAGIIKKGVPVFYNTGSEIADGVIQRTAESRKAPSYKVSEYYEKLPEEVKAVVEDFSQRQNAGYQRDNAMSAVCAFYGIPDLLRSVNSHEMNSQEANSQEVKPYSESSVGQAAGTSREIPEMTALIKSALDAFYWPGRMEEIAPGFVIDGAHNEDAVIRFAQSVWEIMKKGGWEKLSLIFAVCEDKDYESIIRSLCLNLKLEDVYVAELNTARKTPAGEVVSLFQKYRPAGEYWNNFGFTDLKSALRTALGERDNKTLLMAVGSLYLVGEIKESGEIANAATGEVKP